MMSFCVQASCENRGNPTKGNNCNACALKLGMSSTLGSIPTPCPFRAEAWHNDQTANDTPCLWRINKRNQQALRVVFSTLNVDAYDEERNTALDHFVTNDALRDVVPYLTGPTDSNERGWTCYAGIEIPQGFEFMPPGIGFAPGQYCITLCPLGAWMSNSLGTIAAVREYDVSVHLSCDGVHLCPINRVVAIRPAAPTAQISRKSGTSTVGNDRPTPVDRPSPPEEDQRGVRSE